MEIIEALASQIVRSAFSRLLPSYRLQSGMRDILIIHIELQRLQNGLRMLDDPLDEHINLCEREMTDLSNNTQGILDKLDLELRKAGSPGGCLIGIVRLLRAHMVSRQLEKEVRNAEQLLHEIERRRERYVIDPNLVGSWRCRLAAGSSVNLVDGAEIVNGAEDARAKLQALVTDDLPCWLRDNICLLKWEVDWMHTTLSVIASVPVDELDEVTKAWAEDMKEVCCDIKDTADNFRDRIGVGGGGGGAGTRSLKGLIARWRTAGARREFAAGIIDLKKSVAEVAERRQRYNCSHIPQRYNSGSVDDASQPPVVSEEESHPVGIDGPRDHLIRRLHPDEGSTSYLEPQPQLKVASIVGTAGVGKTTLARAVYHRLLPHFDCTAWVSLPDVNPDVRRVLSDLLRQILMSQQDEQQYVHFEAMDERGLINQIRETLHDKRYFVVIDDIWNLELWQFIQHSFIQNGKGSAILTTSQNASIANYIGGVYTLAPLSEIDSRELLYVRLFPCQDTCTPELTEISNKILEKCNGIPLAIVVTVDLLRSKSKTVEDWQAVHGHFGYEFQRDPHLKRIVARCYADLHTNLQPCLLYLGMFPKGYQISRDRIIWGWIAQRFIPETQGIPLQETGETYLNELINRNLVESVDAGGNSLSCRVHDLIYDMIVSLSAEKNFATILHGQQGRSFGDSVYRLSIQGNKAEYSEPDVRTSLSQVSSLVSSNADLMPSLSEFRSLRLMDLSGCESLQNEHLNDIGRLSFLTCLIVRGTGITDIPKEIGGLTCLATLDLRGTSIKELPENIVQLEELKRLYVDSSTKVPNGIGKLESLEELGDISITKSALLKEVCKLIHLRVLRIVICSWDESYNDPLLLDYLRLLARGERRIQSLSIISSSSLHFLDELDAEWSTASLEKLEIRHSTFDKLPKWLCSVQNLTTLSIEVYELSRDIVDMLGEMNNLSSLSLSSKHAPEELEKMNNLSSLSLSSKHAPEETEGRSVDVQKEEQERSVIGPSGFSKLTSFHLFSNAMGKLFEQGTMRSLSRLKLSFQASRTNDVYKGFDFGLENLFSLKHIHVDIICFGASLQLVEDAELEINSAISRNPSCQPELKIQRVREKDIMKNEVQDMKNEMQDQLTNDIKQELQQKEIKEKKRKKKKYKIVSLQLKRRILTLRAL